METEELPMIMVDAIVLFLNQTRNTKINAHGFKDSYELVAAIERFRRERGITRLPKWAKEDV